MSSHSTDHLSGDELNRRVQAHECSVCGRHIFDWQEGARSPDGFTYTECVAHRNKPVPKKETFNAAKHRSEGIKNLEKLGA